MRARSLPLLLVAAAACTPAAEPIPATDVARSDLISLSRPFPLTEPVYGPAFGDQQEPEAVRLGAGYLVAWRDGFQSSPRIFATRVDGAGIVLDPGGIPIAEHRVVVLASTGTIAAIVTATDTTTLRRMDASGAILGATALGPGVVLAAASDGQDFLVISTWTAGLSATRVSGQGLIVSTHAIPGVDIDYPGAEPALAWVGDGYLLAWIECESLILPRRTRCRQHAERLTPDGQMITGASSVIGGDLGWVGEPHVAWNGTTAVVAWHEHASPDDPAPYRVRAVRLGADGLALDVPPLVVTGSTVGPRLAAISGWGDGFRIAWSYNDPLPELRVTTIDAAGAVGPSALLAGPRDHFWYGPYDLACGRECLLAFMRQEGDEHRGYSYDVRAARIDASGAILDPGGFDAATAPRQAGFARTAWSGDRTTVVWEGWHGLDHHLYFARFDRGVGGLDPRGRRLIDDGGQQQAPSLATNGRGYLLNYARIDPATPNFGWGRLARLGGDGEVLESYPAAFDAIASDGQDYLGVSLTDPICMGSPTATFIPGGGGPPGPTTVIGPEPCGSTESTIPFWSLASNGQGYVALWHRCASGVCTMRSAHLDARGAPTRPVADLGASDGDFALDTNGTTYLLAQLRGGTEVEMQALDADGQPTGLPFRAPADFWNHVHVGSDGERFVVTWSEAQRARAAIVRPSGDLVARVTPLSPVVGVAGAGRGQVMLVELPTRSDPLVYRLEAQVLATWTATIGQACAEAADCQTGSCADGVCCDGACGGGVVGDCIACSVRAGGARDGVCGEAVARECRATSGACDAPEVCAAGGGAMCPADVAAADGTPCAGGACAAGVCVPAVGEDAGGVDAAGDEDAGPSQADSGAGGTDAGAARVDGGGPGTLPTEASSCGCGAAGAPADAGWVAVMGLAMAMSRARRRHERHGAPPRLSPRATARPESLPGSDH